MSLPASIAFPVFKSFARLNSLHKTDERTQFFDCKFYPYVEPGVDPVFAVVGNSEVVVCRPSVDESTTVKILKWFHHDDVGASMNSCAWSQDLETGDPLLCCSGESASLKIFNIKTGDIRTLIGHGKNINDVVVSPIDPSIVATASMDYTVRFWSLDPKFERQPCLLICGGEGHREGLLTSAFHATGRFLLTGGMDNVINLWLIPDLPNEDSGTDRPTIVHYPHFSTSAVHTSVVDCVAWYHDLVLSKAAGEGKIVLWRIEGFDSAAPVTARAPTTHEFRPTRSAFGGTYQRLLQFEAPETTPFWMRFSLFTAQIPDELPDGKNGGDDGDNDSDDVARGFSKRPMLAIGNEKSRIHFWDLQALEEWDGQHEQQGQNQDENIPMFGQSTLSKRGGRGGGGAGGQYVGGSGGGAAAGGGIGSGSRGGRGSFRQFNKKQQPQQPQQDSGIGSTATHSRAAQRLAVDDPFRVLVSHKSAVVPKVTFAARQVAWSVGGEWLAMVGDQGMIALFGR